jgi:hypothetical protein
MGAVAATWAAFGSWILLRFFVYTAVVLLCRKALRQGQPFEAEVGWALALKLKTGMTSQDSAEDARSKPGQNDDSLPIRRRNRRLQRDLGPGDRESAQGPERPLSGGSRKTE